eukprot:maker-scaffold152_size304267-snap-gene-1.16 protein:Tk10109 transcript:maker-scaffold152_size304267-snap-gene-1.16-mRNA-1 annotation:"solute carrier family member 24"
MDLDPLLAQVGFGRWQILNLAACCLVTGLSSLIVLSQTFVLFVPEFRCQIAACESSGHSEYDSGFAPFAIPFWDESYESASELKQRQCEHFPHNTTNLTCGSEDFEPDLDATVQCASHVFDRSQMSNTFVMELDLTPCLVVEEQWLLHSALSPVSFLALSFMVGQGLGSLVGGIIGDRIGRLPTMIGFLVFTGVLHLVAAYFPQFWVYFTLRLFSGLGTAGFYIPSFTLAVEFSGDHGALFSSVISIFRAFFTSPFEMSQRGDSDTTNDINVKTKHKTEVYRWMACQSLKAKAIPPKATEPRAVAI